MYKLNELELRNGDHSSSFLDLFTSKWDNIHTNSNIFRYQIDELHEKYVDDYMLLLNADRNTKRRLPEQIDNICQPFDGNKFHFGKVSSKEVLLSIRGTDSDVHSILVNVSPISRYHSLLCPSINKSLPQIATAESLHLAIQLMFNTKDRDLRIAFNSLCAMASVNHLHYHLLVRNGDLAVEKVKWIPLTNQIYLLDNKYPVTAFCFEVPEHSISENVSNVYKLVKFFLEKSIAHNILITRRVERRGSLGVIIWPRKSTKGAKLLSAFNVAALELSGWFTVYDTENFNNLSSKDLEQELRRWRIENFDGLCEEVKNLY